MVTVVAVVALTLGGSAGLVEWPLMSGRALARVRAFEGAPSTQAALGSEPDAGGGQPTPTAPETTDDSFERARASRGEVVRVGSSTLDGGPG